MADHGDTNKHDRTAEHGRIKSGGSIGAIRGQSATRGAGRAIRDLTRSRNSLNRAIKVLSGLKVTRKP